MNPRNRMNLNTFQAMFRLLRRTSLVSRCQFTTSSSGSISYSLRDGIAEIKINRPAKRNAISISMMQELISHGKQIEEEKDVRCVVMSGEGDCFSSGIDLTSFEDSQSLAKAFAHENNNSANLVQQTALIWRSLKVPVIAAINGVCFGAAFQVALGACIRVAHPEAKFSILEISHGLIPDMAISSTARHVIREDFLKLMAYSGEAIDAKTAQAYGVVTLIDDEPLQRAHKLAAQFAKYSPAAIRANKRLIQQAVFAEDLRGLRVEEELQLSLIRSQEFQDRMRNTIAQRRSKK